MMNWDRAGLAGGDIGGGDALYNPAFVSELNKALSAGADIDNPGSSAGEGFPLRVESLDSTLYTVTYEEKHIRFWQTLAKQKAWNTVEEYNRLEERGDGNAIFMAEGDLPQEDDSTYSRNYTQIKFMGTVRRVTDVLTRVRTAHGDAVAREAKNGTLFLLRELERNLFEGDSSLLDLQFDGLEKLLINAYGTTVEDDGQLSGYGDDNVIDLRGEPLTEDVITDLADILVNTPNYGAPNKLWAPTGPLKDVSKQMFPSERTKMGERGIAGVYAQGMRTPFGDIGFEPDIFIQPSQVPSASGVGETSKRPALPTLGAPAAAANPRSQFSASDAGAYFYKVVGCNRYGKSAPATSAAVTLADGEDATIAVTSTSTTKYFEIFRSDKDGAASTCKRILRVARSAAVQSVVDINRFLPNTDRSFMLTQTPEIMSWKQLAPFTKMNLAVIDTSIRFMLLLYGALQVMQPRKCGMIINIGRLETGAYAS